MELGRFIAFEGGEGAGKSTQARLLADDLQRQGRRCVLTREPGGTAGAEAIRKLLLNPPGEGWSLEAEALLFGAARADHVARLIRPAVARGEWVVCDRFLDSSRAYQGAAGGLGDDCIQAIHAIGSGGVLPDLTIVLTAPAPILAKRLSARDQGRGDAIGGRPASYHRRVEEAFRGFAAAEPERFVLVDGSKEIAEVHAFVLDAIARLC